MYYTDKNYERYIEIFLNEFLGHHDFIKILNPKDVSFAFDKSTKTLHAKAKKSLKIENEYLGYIIEYHLLNFTRNAEIGRVSYSGTSFYKEMEGNERKKNTMES